MFGTLVEVEGAGERRWGRLAGVRLPNRMRIGGFSGRALHGFGAYGATTNPTWVFDDEGNVTMGAEPASTGDSLAAILGTISAVAPSLLGVVKTAIERGTQPTSAGCPPGYAYYSAIARRCFRTPQEMSEAEQAIFAAQSSAGGGGMNTALMVGAGVLGLVGLVMFLKK